MQVLQSVFNYILNDLGSTIFMPIIMFLVCIVVRMTVKKSLNAALMLGVAFAAVSAVVDIMMGTVMPLMIGFSVTTGANLVTADVGWAVSSAITFSWPYVFLLFPLQIAINLIMIGTKMTRVLNVDMFNVWNKGFTAYLVSYFSGSVVFGMVVAAIEIICELLIGDAIQPQIEKYTGVPNVTTPHPSMLLCGPMYVVDIVLKKIPFLNKEFDLNHLKEKLGFFCENHVMGFILGLFISLVAKCSIKDSVINGITLGAAMTLMPMAAKLFMNAFNPLAEGATEFMKKKLGDREIVVGVDWYIIAGLNEMWVAAVVTVPLVVLLAIILPGNTVLPIEGVVMLGVMQQAVLVCDRNVLRMIVQCILWTVPELYIATYFAEPLTELASVTGAYAVEAGSSITHLGMEAPVFRWAWSYLSSGHFIGILFVLAWGFSTYLYIKHCKETYKAK